MHLKSTAIVALRKEIEGDPRIANLLDKADGTISWRDKAYQILQDAIKNAVLAKELDELFSACREKVRWRCLAWELKK